MNMNAIFSKENNLALPQDLGLYIHVPFCRQRCGYCDFYSQTDVSLQDAFVKRIQSDIDELAPREIPIKTLYFGGGTPSLLGPYIGPLVSYIRSRLEVVEGAEITVEVNPESFSLELLTDFIHHGVNRISIGIQALDDDVLLRVGRLHDAHRALDALEMLHNARINYSVDLITGIPGTTVKDSESWIEQVAAQKPHHLSLYPLTISHECALAKKSAFTHINEDESAEHLLQAWHKAESLGYQHYEISNFALSGCESVHNTRYWETDPYLGLGPSASSALDMNDGSRMRFTQPSDIKRWLATNDHFSLDCVNTDFEVLSAQDAQRESLMLLMRMKTGVSLQDVQLAGLRDLFDEFIQKGFISFNSQTQRYQPTEYGWMLGNDMFGAIWCYNKKM